MTWVMLMSVSKTLKRMFSKMCTSWFHCRDYGYWVWIGSHHMIFLKDPQVILMKYTFTYWYRSMCLHNAMFILAKMR